MPSYSSPTYTNYTVTRAQVGNHYVWIPAPQPVTWHTWGVDEVIKKDIKTKEGNVLKM